MSSLVHTIAATRRVPTEDMPLVPPTRRWALRVLPTLTTDNDYPIFISRHDGHPRHQPEWDDIRLSGNRYEYYYRMTEDQYQALIDPRNRFEFARGGNDLLVFQPNYRTQTLHRFDGEPTYNYFKWQTLCDEVDNTTSVLDWLVHHAQTAAGVDKADVRARLTERDYRAREFHYRCGVARILHTFHENAPDADLAAYLQIHAAEQERVRSEGGGHARFTDWNAIAVEFMDSVFPVITEGPNAGLRALHPDRAHPAASAAQITADFVTPVVERMEANPSGLTHMLGYSQFEETYVNPPPADSGEDG